MSPSLLFPPSPHPLLTFALLAGVMVVLLWAGAPFLARHLLFFPPPHDPGPAPVLAGVEGENLRLTARDGTELAAWWFPAPGDAPPAVLGLHGNASSIAAWGPLASEYLARGISVLLLSYRGYGRSEGRPSLDGVPLDARAALDFLARETGAPERVVVHGRSIGGAVGLAALELEGPPPGGFILESTFTSLVDVARAVYPILPRPLLGRLSGRLDAKRALGTFEGAVLVIHGDRDEIIPTRMGEELHAAARDPRGLWLVEGASHNDLTLVAGSRYPERLADFVLEVAGER